MKRRKPRKPKPIPLFIYILFVMSLLLYIMSAPIIEAGRIIPGIIFGLIANLGLFETGRILIRRG